MQNKIQISLILLLLLLIHSSVFGFCFKQAGNTYQISPVLIKTIARVESGLDPAAVNQNKNGSYDIGLMQINSSWQKHFGEKWQQISTPCYNVMAGAWILKQCMDRYGYTWDAVACYHTGKGLSDSTQQKQRLAQKYIQRVQIVMEKSE